MMVSRGWCVLAGFLLLLAGCASGPPAVPDTRALFLDDQFKPVPGLVVESQEQIFALAPELADRLRAQSRQSGSTEQRLKTLLAQIYTDAGIRLDYNVGHSTGAAETWANKRGDCLSLTILAYSAARVLDVEARMQEVPGPALVDRRGDIDFVTGHVNLHVRARNSLLISQ
jgi:transglutaminase-like putative cysteine protease